MLVRMLLTYILLAYELLPTVNSRSWLGSILSAIYLLEIRKMALLQIIRFTLPASSTISAPKFRELREYVASKGKVKAQYFGYVTSPKYAALPKERHEICWVIRMY